MKKKLIGVYLKKKQYKKFKEISKKNNRDISKELRFLIEKHIKNNS